MVLTGIKLIGQQSCVPSEVPRGMHLLPFPASKVLQSFACGCIALASVFIITSLNAEPPASLLKELFWLLWTHPDNPG